MKRSNEVMSIPLVGISLNARHFLGLRPRGLGPVIIPIDLASISSEAIQARPALSSALPLRVSFP